LEFLNSDKKDEQEEIEWFARSYLGACMKSLEPYFKDKQGELFEDCAKTCAKYITRSRGPNTHKLPYDVWTRFVDKLIDDL